MLISYTFTCMLSCSGFDIADADDDDDDDDDDDNDDFLSSLVEFRWRGHDDVVQYVTVEADDPFIVQSLFSASFSRDGVFVIGN